MTRGIVKQGSRVGIKFLVIRLCLHAAGDRIGATLAFAALAPTGAAAAGTGLASAGHKPAVTTLDGTL